MRFKKKKKVNYSPSTKKKKKKMYYSNKIKERLRNVDKDLTWILLENFQSLVEDTISCIPDHISLENEKFY